MQIDVIGIGSPLLDIIINISDEQLVELGFPKGSMNLISKDDSLRILSLLENLEKEYSPGGSSANTLSGVNILGNRAAFVGVIGQDEHGALYKSQTEGEGVISRLQLDEEKSTGHAFILITPDGERTMAAHLGAAIAMKNKYLNEQEVAAAKIMHVEAYQLEDEALYKILHEAFQIAKKNNTLVSLDLSDTHLIRRNKELFKEVVKEHVDILFANEDEALEFTGVSGEEALMVIANHCKVAVVKLGSKGSILMSAGNIYRIEPHNVEMINTNGAGDMYAAGILHGLVNGMDLQTAGEIASHVSALVVNSPGARLHPKHFDSISKYKRNN